MFFLYLVLFNGPQAWEGCGFQDQLIDEEKVMVEQICLCVFFWVCFFQHPSSCIFLVLSWRLTAIRNFKWISYDTVNQFSQVQSACFVCLFCCCVFFVHRRFSFSFLASASCFVFLLFSVLDVATDKTCMLYIS